MLITTIILSTILTISSSSWVIVWIFIEVNTISICMLIENSNNETMEKNQTTVNYYIIQCVASVVLLSVIITNEISQETNIVAGVLILIINIGVWPFHIWYMNVLSELNINSNPFLIIVTWQKIMPIIIMISVANINSQEIIIIVIVNILVIIIILNNNTSINSIIILSSGFNNSIIIVSSISLSIIVTFIGMYSASIIIALSMVSNTNNNSINPNNQTLGEAIITANLGGIPPFLMFFGNIMVINNLISLNIIELSFFMILIICGFMYHYYWAMSSMLIESTSKTQMHINSNIITLSTVLLVTSLASALLVIILGLTKSVYLDSVNINNL